MCSLISIIIPCYNCERYFSQLFNTLTKQTYSHWEAICIDDGSTDNTEKLLTEYARKDNRIKYFYQTNQGAAKARAYGISKASGEFITFLDADDTLSCNALEKFLKAFADADTDIVVSGFNIIKQSHLVKSKRLSKQKLHSVDYLKRYFAVNMAGSYGLRCIGENYLTIPSLHLNIYESVKMRRFLSNWYPMPKIFRSWMKRFTITYSMKVLHLTYSRLNMRKKLYKLDSLLRTY